MIFYASLAAGFILSNYLTYRLCKGLLFKQHEQIKFLQNELHNRRIEISDLYLEHENYYQDWAMINEELQKAHNDLYTLSQKLDYKPQIRLH